MIFLENLLHENNPNKWFAGNSMSVADLAIWRLLGWIISGKLDQVPTTLLETFFIALVITVFLSFKIKPIFYIYKLYHLVSRSRM